MWNAADRFIWISFCLLENLEKLDKETAAMTGLSLNVHSVMKNIEPWKVLLQVFPKFTFGSQPN